ncbi:MAG: cytochrome P450 [Roseococcus sp.]|nr:cytochrome P450 [Roseococcus sp.]
MSGATPPFPPRHKGEIPVTELLAKASRSLLEVWGEEMFRNSGTTLEVLGQRLIIFNRPAAIEAVLVTQAESFAAKPPQLSKLLAPLMGQGLFIAEGARWRARRPLTTAAMAELADGLDAVIAAWAAQWAARPEGDTIELIGAMEQVSAEMLLRLLFGPAGDAAAAAQIMRLAHAYRAKISGAGLITLMALPDPLVRLRLGGDAKRIRAVVAPLIARARKAGSGLIAALPADAAAEEVISLFGMGHDALSGLLAATWFLLAEAPEVEAALHAELDSGAEDRPMTRAVLREALRLYPPVPLIARVAGRATQVPGMAVPQGSLAFVSPWLVHRHADHWEAPDEFRPARFLPGAPAPAPFTYLPFGLGPRGCVGEAFTLRAAEQALATLARRFRLARLPGRAPIPTAGLTLSLALRLPMRLTRRTG